MYFELNEYYFEERNSVNELVKRAIEAEKADNK